jgi:hypothetical protein
MGKVTKIRPDVGDSVESTIKRSKEFILISIGEHGVEVGSSLEDERGLFYIELAKHMILRDWLGDSPDDTN